MYKLTLQGTVLRLADGASIPPAADNADYQVYLAWVAAGNSPEAADEPSLNEVKAAAVASVEMRVEQAKVTAGIIVSQPGMVAQYASNAFYVERWIAAGRPASPDPADYPTAEAERQGFDPVLTLAEMLGLWETMWGQMNAANAGVMLARRLALTAIAAAADPAAVAAAVENLEL